VQIGYRHANAGQPGGDLWITYHQTPRDRICEKRMQQGVCQIVTGFVARVAAQNGAARRVQITQRVQHLVADGLIWVAQTAGGQHFGTVDDNRIFKRSAKSKVVCAHVFDVSIAAKGAAVAKLTHKAAIRHVKRLALMTDCGIGKVDLEVDLQARRRTQRSPSIAMAGANLVQNLDRQQGRGQTGQARGNDTARKGRSLTGPPSDVR
jgi:hypothetical protein